MVQLPSSCAPPHLTVLSPEPLTTVLPSELMATLRTDPVCPSSVLVHSPDSRSHTLGVWEARQ